MSNDKIRGLGFDLGFNKGYTLALERLQADIVHSMPCANEQPIEYAYKEMILDLIKDKIKRFTGKGGKEE